jgi:hypothetical protein
VKIQSLSKLLLSIAILNVTACAFKEDTTEEPKVKEAKPSDIVDTIERGRDQQANDIKLTNENVKIRFDELPDPNAYRAVITWPANIKRMQITEPNELPTLINGSNEYSRVVSGNSKLKVGLSALDSFGVSISTLKLEATAPFDFELNSDLILKEATRYSYNRFFMRSGSQIKTDGHDLAIEVNKLFVEEDHRRKNGKWSKIYSNIITHFPGEISSGTSPMLGSNITIRAKEAHGLLTVALVGLNGKNGKSGETLEQEKNISRAVDPSLRGIDGIAGLSTEIHGRCRAGAAMDAQSQCGRSSFRCERQPTNGTNGLKGASGTNGENGMKGGNAGRIQFFIDNHQQFKADIFDRAGKGGVGGKGSERFKGGSGGVAGTNVQGCVAAQNGANGPAGDLDGKNGDNADNGDGATTITGGVSVSTFPF